MVEVDKLCSRELPAKHNSNHINEKLNGQQQPYSYNNYSFVDLH